MSNEDCVFCKIVAGDIPSYTVYQTSEVTAFLDVNPLSMGHTLFVPNGHHERLQDLPDDEATALWKGVQTVLPAIESAVDADATTVGVNNGEASGQEVPHVHVHVVPRFQGDGGNPIHAVGGRAPAVTEDDFETIQQGIEGSI